MFFEFILNANAVFVVSSPLILIVLFVSGFKLPKDEFVCCIGAGLILSIIGCLWILPVDPGAWGFGVILYLFMVPWWFSVGYMGAMLLVSYSSMIKRICCRLIVITFILQLGFMVLAHAYAFEARSKSYSTIIGYLKGSVSESVMIEDGHVDTEHFRTVVLDHLARYHAEMGEEQIRFLVSRGFNIYQCKNLPREMIENALLHYEKDSLGSAGLTSDSLASLAKNPSLTLDDFERFVKKDDKLPYFWSLVENPNWDEDRYRMMRNALEKLLKEDHLPEVGNQSFHADILQRIKTIDQMMERKKTSQ
jgi:hypothetical protein